MSKSVTKNYMYNMIYQILILITPLITTPYVSRVLTPSKIGLYGYTQSIVTYFTLIGTVGVAMYAERETAYIQGNCETQKRKRSLLFYEIVLFRAITVGFALIVYWIMFVNGSKYQLLYAIQIIDIVANIFDISWFFQGMEEFKKTVFRNMLVKILCVIAIFAFVKSKQDLYLYALCYSLSLILGNLSLWFYLPKYLTRISFRQIKIFRHTKATVMLFIPQIATQIYTVLDKTMLGKLATSMNEVGYYEQSQKIIRLLLTLITSLGVVMLPRMAKNYAKNDTNMIQSYLDKSFRYTYMIAFPVIFGLICVGKTFVPIFYGPGYEPVKGILIAISPVILLIGLSNVIGTQYQIPTNKQRDYTLSVVMGAITNFLLNLILISQYDAMGAVISTVVAEFVVLFVHFYCVRKEIDVKKSILCCKNYLIASLIMFLIIEGISFLKISNSLIEMFIQIIVGGFVYILCLFLFSDELIKMLWSKIKYNIYGKYMNGKGFSK